LRARRLNDARSFTVLLLSSTVLTCRTDIDQEHMSTRGDWDVRFERGLRVDTSTTPGGPSIQHARSAWLTYEPFYGLTEQPFSLASNPAFFHQSQSHASTFQGLLAGIRRRERLSVLTGDIGTGKTTLCRAVLENLDRETFSAFVADPFASREDLLKVLLMEFGVMSLDDLTSGRLKTASRTELSYLLYDFLGKLAPLQAFAVVIIDEAQNLSLPLLEELRILSDFDGRDRQLQVVLVGQLELRQKLKLAEMRQVDQRVSVRCHLEPLSSDAVAGYVAHRLRVAGGTADRVSFSADACEAVYQASNGIPRLINRICDRALHHGYLARAAVIDGNLVRAAVHELGASLPNTAANLPAVDAAVNVPFAVNGTEDLPESLAAAGGERAKPADEAPRERPSHRGRAPAATAHPRSISLPRTTAALDHRSHPRTYMQQLARQWWRMASIATLLIVTASALTLGVSALEAVTADVDAESAAPVLPALPARVPVSTPPAFQTPTSPEMLPPQGADEGSYTIEVALFETRQGATWFAGDLARVGYRAYGEELAFPNRGTHYLVAIGPYATRATAEFDLRRLHLTPGYEHARLRDN
jgi:type II secretory pathway predicted ATPase ExeA/septal ring-binding cell division protein DamX